MLKKMNLIIFFVQLVSLVNSHEHMLHKDCKCHQHNQDQNQHQALKYDFSPKERCTYYGSYKDISGFIACPASSKQQVTINDRVSITGKSLFLRNTHGLQKNINLNICNYPVEPAMLYNTASKMYEIGYEFYYKDDKFRWKDGTNLYHVYKPVNLMRNNEVINDTNKKLIFEDGCPKMIFNWLSALSIASSKNNKQIELHDYDESEGSDAQESKTIADDDAIRCKCEDYDSRQVDMKIYTSSKEKPKKRAARNTQSYGRIALSQIIPLWYFRENWAKAASCSYMNMIPVWKSIAEGQLKKVDLYIQAIIRRLGLQVENKESNCNISNLIFGVNGVLTLKNETHIHPDQQQRMYLLKNYTSHREIIPIPKIIYRVIQGRCENSSNTAIVVIHNDPNSIPDEDRICNKSEEISGWEKIRNDDPRTGFTYVCELNDFMKRVLIHDEISIPNSSDNVIEPLRLNNLTKANNFSLSARVDYLNNANNFSLTTRVDYYDANNFSLTTRVDYYDATRNIDQEFERLLNLTAMV